MLTGERDLEAVRARLAAWLRDKLPRASGLGLSPPARPSAGLSNETYLFDLQWRENGAPRTLALVVRLQPTAFQVFPEYDLGKQVRILQSLRHCEVPVPAVRWFEPDPAVLGCAFYVMEKIDGEIPSEVPPLHAFGMCADATPERRARIWWSGVDTLARIHRLDWPALGLSFLGVPGGGTDPLDRQLAYYAHYLDWARGAAAQPTLAAALDWLRAQRFAPEHVGLCWGDARLPNMIFRDDRVVAVLDWEMAFLGDPEADLGWWLFLDWSTSEGYGIPRLPGFPEREETIARYEALTGRPVAHAFYYEVFAAFRFGAIMARVARRMQEIGLQTPTPDFATNNPCTQRLAHLLGLPAPGAAGPRTVTRLDAVSVRVQFHLTGPGGGDWYLVSEAGRATRHEGTVADPQATLTARAADWAAIQSGALDRIQAYMGGKLRIDGDATLLMQLEDTIAKLSR